MSSIAALQGSAALCTPEPLSAPIIHAMLNMREPETDTSTSMQTDPRMQVTICHKLCRSVRVSLLQSCSGSAPQAAAARFAFCWDPS